MIRTNSHNQANFSAAEGLMAMARPPAELRMAHPPAPAASEFIGPQLPPQQQQAGVQAGTVVSTRSSAPAKQRVQTTQRVQKQARVSTRSAAPKKPVAISGKRYVQVGTFGVASNAQKTAQRIQRMGLPVRIGKFNRGGKELRIVLAGPFKSASHTGGALTALRNAGYRDAFARN